MLSNQTTRISWKSFEIVGWNNYIIELFSYLRRNDLAFPIVCHIQYLAILSLKIFMEEWSLSTVVPYYGSVPRKFELWTQISAKFKVWPCIFDTLLHHEGKDLSETVLIETDLSEKAQVLSEIVAEVLFTTGPANTNATAKLCLMMDQFFDCLNVRKAEEHKVKLKKFLRPYKDVNDARFAWLAEFLEYLALWKQPMLQRQGNFRQRDRDAMFLPWQSYEGLQMSVLLLKAFVPYLLNNGMKCSEWKVLSRWHWKLFWKTKSYRKKKRQSQCQGCRLQWKHDKAAVFCATSR